MWKKKIIDSLLRPEKYRYCTKCYYFDDNYSAFGICRHPSNIKAKIHTPFGKRIEYKKLPGEINENIDCKNYISKTSAIILTTFIAILIGYILAILSK
jgi:hypothetical protein